MRVCVLYVCMRVCRCVLASVRASVRACVRACVCVRVYGVRVRGRVSVYV